MPYPVQNLLQDRRKPITVRPQEKARAAIETMLQHDFSQLPVVDEAFRAVGVVTYQSIIEALSNFGTNIDELLVAHATVKADRFAPDDDLFDLLDRLQEKYAVLIVNREQKLVGIVTTYDSTDYFRRRAEDMMIVEDIESMLKDMIRHAFAATEDDVEVASLKEAISAITDDSNKMYGIYKQAVKQYLQAQNPDHTSPPVNTEALKASFEPFSRLRRQKQFEDLTLADYIELFLHDGAWRTYAEAIQLHPNSIRTLFTAVCRTRNDLAHFRGDLTSSQRAQLRFCSTWLSQYQPLIPALKSDGQVLTEIDEADIETVSTPAESVQTDPGITQYQDEAGSNESRYASLAIFLQTQPSRQDRVVLSFGQVEQIIDDPLPSSARAHRNWWANDSVSHVQSQQWLDAGWRVAQVNMTEEVVTFARIRERERAYINFFAQFLTDLRSAGNQSVTASSPDGQSWMQLHSVATNNISGLHYVIAFARSKQFRVELYIDTGNGELNKQLFDSLEQQKQALEEAIGAELSWERLNEKRASRIAWYHAGTIDDDAERLVDLRRWAVDALMKFRSTIDNAVDSIVQTLPDAQSQ